MQNRFGLLDTDVMPMFMIIALDIVRTLRSSINCSAVIFSPTIIFAILREATCETDTSILHHAFISIFIALWAVITHYVSIVMDILSYFIRFTMKRGNADSWNSGWKRSKHWKPILHNSKRPKAPRNNFLDLIRIFGQKK